MTPGLQLRFNCTCTTQIVDYYVSHSFETASNSLGDLSSGMNMIWPRVRTVVETLLPSMMQKVVVCLTSVEAVGFLSTPVGMESRSSPTMKSLVDPT